MSRPWWYVAFGRLMKTLLALYRAKREGRMLTISELARETVITTTTFYNTVRRALVEGGFAEIIPSPRERVIEVRLTDKGRKLAKCIEEASIEV